MRTVNSDNGTPLLCACSVKSNIENVRTLIEHGADINWTTKKSNTALHFAARYVDSEKIEFY